MPDLRPSHSRTKIDPYAHTDRKGITALHGAYKKVKAPLDTRLVLIGYGMISVDKLRRTDLVNLARALRVWHSL